MTAESQFEKSLLGKKLGHYRLDSLLGRGGMGVVFRGTDTHLQREVAVKVLSEDLLGRKSVLQRFVQEARLAAKLSHPNVVTIHEVNRQEQLVYIVMELMDGGSAEDFLSSSGPYSWKMGTQITASVCRGLVTAHRIGLIHRDIKPANIMLGSDGEIKLADFGLAKAVEPSAPHLTSAGTVLGTPLYMSPEQCQGEPVDETSDVYSLGATYYALLTGKPPFPSPSPMHASFAHCSSPIPDPRSVKNDVPESCTSVIQRAMAKQPGDRYQSASQMLDDLMGCLSPAPPIPKSALERNADPLGVGQLPSFNTTPVSPVQQRRGSPIRISPVTIGVLASTLLFFVIVAMMLWPRPDDRSQSRENTDHSSGTRMLANPVATESDSAAPSEPTTPASKLEQLFEPPTPEEVQALVSTWATHKPSIVGWRVERVMQNRLGLRVVYVSCSIDGRRIYAALRFPQGFEENQSYPLLVYNHDAVSEFSLRDLMNTRRRLPVMDQFVVLIPAYRGGSLGEALGGYTSEGEPGGLDEDADDTIALLDAVTANTAEVDARRIALLGLARGGNVALQVAARDRRVVAVIGLSPATDFFLPSLHNLARNTTQVDRSPSNPAVIDVVDRIIKPLVGDEMSIDTARRRLLSCSPAWFAKELPRTQVHYGAFYEINSRVHGDRLEAAARKLGRVDKSFERFDYEDDPNSQATMRQFSNRAERLLQDVVDGKLKRDL